jgi:hypothetical protein
MPTTSVREYAILYVGGRRLGESAGTTAGGNTILNAGQHAIDGPEHTGHLLIDSMADVDTTTVAPTTKQTLVWNGTNWVPSSIEGLGTTETDTTKILHPDGAGGTVWTVPAGGSGGGLIPVMATDPTLVTTDGETVWLVLTTLDGEPVMVTT